MSPKKSRRPDCQPLTKPDCRILIKEYNWNFHHLERRIFFFLENTHILLRGGNSSTLGCFVSRKKEINAQLRGPCIQSTVSFVFEALGKGTARLKASSRKLRANEVKTSRRAIFNLREQLCNCVSHARHSQMKRSCTRDLITLSKDKKRTWARAVSVCSVLRWEDYRERDNKREGRHSGQCFAKHRFPRPHPTPICAFRTRFCCYQYCGLFSLIYTYNAYEQRNYVGI